VNLSLFVKGIVPVTIVLGMDVRVAVNSVEGVMDNHVRVVMVNHARVAVIGHAKAVVVQTIDLAIATKDEIDRKVLTCRRVQIVKTNFKANSRREVGMGLNQISVGTITIGRITDEMISNVDIKVEGQIRTVIIAKTALHHKLHKVDLARNAQCLISETIPTKVELRRIQIRGVNMVHNVRDSRGTDVSTGTNSRLIQINKASELRSLGSSKKYLGNSPPPTSKRGLNRSLRKPRAYDQSH
jgi:hypothetical protein